MLTFHKHSPFHRLGKLPVYIKVGITAGENTVKTPCLYRITPTLLLYTNFWYFSMNFSNYYGNFTFNTKNSPNGEFFVLYEELLAEGDFIPSLSLHRHPLLQHLPVHLEGVDALDLILSDNFLPPNFLTVNGKDYLPQWCSCRNGCGDGLR